MPNRTLFVISRPLSFLTTNDRERDPIDAQENIHIRTTFDSCHLLTAIEDDMLN